MVFHLYIQIETLEMLLEAYDNEDAKTFRTALNSPFIKHLDVEYSKLARGLPLPQHEYTIRPVGVRANAAEPYVSPNDKSSKEETEIKVDHVSLIVVLWCRGVYGVCVKYKLFIRREIDFPEKQRC